MKRKLFIILTSCIFSIATFCSLSQKDMNDISLNQVGVATYAYGRSIESSGLEWAGVIGGGIGASATGIGILGAISASAGAGTIGAGAIGAAAGLVVISNPIGWVVGGIAIGL